MYCTTLQRSNVAKTPVSPNFYNDLRYGFIFPASLRINNKRNRVLSVYFNDSRSFYCLARLSESWFCKISLAHFSAYFSFKKYLYLYNNE